MIDAAHGKSLADKHAPVLDKQARSFRQLLSFEPPRQWLALRRLAYAANRVYLHSGFGHGRVTLAIPEPDLAKLRALPPGSGNMLIEPHPAPLDANLMFHRVTGCFIRRPADACSKHRG
jgi:hypothetical protein